MMPTRKAWPVFLRLSSPEAYRSALVHASARRVLIRPFRTASYVANGVELYFDCKDLLLRTWPAMVNHSDDPELINCALKDPAEGDYRPQLELLRDVKAGTMLYRDYGKKYWQGREHEIADESVSDCGKCITLTLTHDYFDSFPDRAPLFEARAASEYWQRRIGQHAATLATVVLARAYHSAF